MGKVFRALFLKSFSINSLGLDSSAIKYAIGWGLVGFFYLPPCPAASVFFKGFDVFTIRPKE
jgi:hypothetical protein